MKHKLHGFVVVALLVVGALACHRTDTITELSTTPISVEAAIAEQVDAPAAVSSRVKSTGFDDGDQISFFAVRYTAGVSNELGKDATTYLNNKLYQREAGFFQSYDGASTFKREYFPNDGSSIDIYGIYPYRADAIADYTKYLFKIADNQSAIADYNKSDMMMAKTGGIAPTAIPNKLIFKHLLSRVVLNIKLVNFANGEKIQSVRLLNVKPEASVNLRLYDAGAGDPVTIVDATAATNVVPFNEAVAAVGYEKMYSAVIVPQTLAKDANLIEVTLDNANKDVYTLKLNANFTTVSAMEHAMNVVVNFGSREAIIPAPTISAWGENLAEAMAQKESDFKFVITLVNVPGGNVLNQTAKVKVTFNGNQTRELTRNVGYNTTLGENGQPAVYFEFPGEGNRPGGVPFKLTKIEFISAANTSLGVQAMDIDVTAMGTMKLVYDVTAGTITKVIP